MAQVKSSEQKQWILRCPLRPFRLKESSVFNNSIWVKNSWNLIHLRLTSHVEIVQNRCRNDLKQKKRLSMCRIWFKEQKKNVHTVWTFNQLLTLELLGTLAPHREYLHWVGWLPQPVSYHLEGLRAQELFWHLSLCEMVWGVLRYMCCF